MVTNETCAPDGSVLIAIADALDAASQCLRSAAAVEATVNISPTPTGDDKLLITIGEAADRLSIGRSFAYQLAQTGALPTVQLGRRRLVPVHALVSMVTTRG